MIQNESHGLPKRIYLRMKRKSQNYRNKLRTNDQTKSKSTKRQQVDILRSRDSRARSWTQPTYASNYIRVFNRAWYPRNRKDPVDPITLIEAVPLSEREELTTQELKHISNTLLTSSREKLNQKSLEKLIISHSPEICLEIISYIPYNIIENSKHYIHNKEIRKIVKSAQNAALIRRDISNKKFWINQPIEATSSSNKVLSEPLSMYIRGKANPALQFRSLTTEENSHLSIPVDKTKVLRNAMDINTTKYKGSIIPRLSHFKRNFQAFTNGIFEGIPLHNAYIGGSCVTACLQHLPTHLMKLHWELDDLQDTLYECLPLPPEIKEIIINIALYEKEKSLIKKLKSYYDYTQDCSDIDVFFAGNNRNAAFKAISLIYEEITEKFQAQEIPWKLVRSRNAITICSGAPTRNIQLVLLIFQDIREQLCFADMDCTANLYDGTTIWTTERAIRAFNTRWNFIAPAILAHIKSCGRLMKYRNRGFGNLFYELCKHQPRCDIVPTSITLNGLKQLNRRNFYSGSYDSYVEYYPCWDLEKIMQNLQQKSLLYDSNDIPWVIGNVLEELVFEKDLVSFGSKEAVNDKLLPLRWKRIHEAMKYPGLLPRCYMCKKHSGDTFESDDTMNKIVPICDECRQINQEKRSNFVALHGKIALVTGGRIKIGYSCVLSLLRAGALVIVTTRFPYDASRRLKEENDYEQWCNRIHIYSVDFRSLPSVQMFINHIKKSYDRLDILINNAAQTIHRPPAYYEDIAQFELDTHQLIESKKNQSISLPYKAVKSLEGNPFLLTDSDSSSQHSMPLVTSHSGAVLSRDVPPISSPLFGSQYAMVPVLPSDNLDSMEKALYFPKGKYDEHKEPIDLRVKNTWNSTVSEIHPVELLEVQLVNSVVPSMLVSQFTELLEIGSKKSYDKAFIVNVTSSEGQFSGPKVRGHHPHTNMAKAALNMMTRTIAESMASKGIYVNSVDTGWISKMVPGGAQTLYTANAPLSLDDGAARILDPVYSSLSNSGNLPPHGVLFKDFAQTTW